MSATVILQPWGSEDMPLLERLMGDPRMTDHIGGPEGPEKLRERQGRYERLTGGDRMLKIPTWRAVAVSAPSASGRRSGAASRSTRSAG